MKWTRRPPVTKDRYYWYMDDERSYRNPSGRRIEAVFIKSTDTIFSFGWWSTDPIPFPEGYEDANISSI